ncbi:hypothetical protein LXL04_030251 [Taraxacum kok-saghyz]
MDSSSGTKKDNSMGARSGQSDDDGIDLSFFDFSQQTFKPTLNSCDDPFLNLLCDENLLRSGIDRMRADQTQHDVKGTEHPHINEVNQEQVGVEYMIHDPTMASDQMRLVLGDCYESPEQLKFDLTNYDVKNGYQVYFEKSDRLRVIGKCGKYSHDAVPCLLMVAAGWKYNERTFQIKSICETHICARNYNFGSLVTSTWLAKHCLKDIIMKPKLSLVEMKDDTFRRVWGNVKEQGCEDVFINCDELFDDLFSHKPYVPYTVPDDDASEGGEYGIHEVDVHFIEHMGKDRHVEAENEHVEAVQQVNEELMVVVLQLNMPDLTDEDMDVVRDMFKGGYVPNEISYTLGIARVRRHYWDDTFLLRGSSLNIARAYVK